MDPSRKNSKKLDISLDGTRKNSSNLLVPSYIFQDRRLTPLEALVKYLREKRRLSYNAISRLISRNVRDVYKLYAHAFDKSSSSIRYDSRFSCFIPVSIFSNRRLSALEALVLYLKEQLNLSYREISVVLSRDQRTIWTVYKRSKIKNVR